MIYDKFQVLTPNQKFIATSLKLSKELFNLMREDEDLDLLIDLGDSHFDVLVERLTGITEKNDCHTYNILLNEFFEATNKLPANDKDFTIVIRYARRLEKQFDIIAKARNFTPQLQRIRIAS